MFDEIHSSCQRTDATRSGSLQTVINTAHYERNYVPRLPTLDQALECWTLVQSLNAQHPSAIPSQSWIPQHLMHEEQLNDGNRADELTTHEIGAEDAQIVNSNVRIAQQGIANEQIRA